MSPTPSRAVVAVLLGVAFIGGSLALSAASHTVLDEQLGTVAAGADLAVRRAVAPDPAQDIEVTRDAAPAPVLATIRAVPGVAQAQPVARGQGLILVGSRAVVPAGASLLESWSPAPFNPYQLHAGRPPAADDEVVLDVSTALTRRIRLGDTVDVRSAHRATFRVVGLVGSGPAGTGPSSALALVPLPAAQRLLGSGAGASDVDVRAADGLDIDALRSRLAAALGPAYQVSPNRDVAGPIAAGSSPAVAVRDASVVPLALGVVLVLAGLVVVGPAVVRPLPPRPRRATPPGDATRLTGPEPAHVLRSRP
jgi:putative ABC transport system permease protein